MTEDVSGDSPDALIGPSGSQVGRDLRLGSANGRGLHGTNARTGVHDFLGLTHTRTGWTFSCLLRWGISDESSRGMNNRTDNMLARVGQVSYSVYLIHIPVIYVLLQYTALGNTGAAWAVRAAVFSTASIGAGFLFYVCVERWFLNGRCPDFMIPWRLKLQRTEQVKSS